MKKFSDILESKDNYVYSHGCLMMFFDIPWWKEYISTIDKNDVFDENNKYGIENEPHITILYGFHSDIEPNDIKELLLGIPKMYIELKEIDIFNNPRYDVVKFKIENEFLQNVHDSVKQLPNENTFPSYNPHMTIFYAKPGRGVKYMGGDNNLKILKPSKIVYSKPIKDGKKTEKIDLKIW